MLSQKRGSAAKRRSRVGLETLEGRELLSMGVSFSDRSVRTVSDSVGKVVVSVVASAAGPDVTPTAVTVNLATEGGTAVAGVDYVPVKQTLTFAAGETSKNVEIPILRGDPSLGSRTLKVSLSPTPANPLGATEYIVIQHGPDKTPPKVESARALTKGGKVVAFSITFSEDMAPGPVQDVSNYAIGDPASLRSNPKLGWVGMTRNIALKSATYDSATRTVVLTPVGKVKSFPIYTILDPTTNSVLQAFTTSTDATPPVFLSGISALTDRAGNPITTPNSYESENDTNGMFSAEAPMGKAGQSILKIMNTSSTQVPKPVKAKPIKRRR